jgi:hypothetical protein
VAVWQHVVAGRAACLDRDRDREGNR